MKGNTKVQNCPGDIRLMFLWTRQTVLIYWVKAVEEAKGKLLLMFTKNSILLVAWRFDELIRLLPVRLKSSRDSKLRDTASSWGCVLWINHHDVQNWRFLSEKLNWPNRKTLQPAENFRMMDLFPTSQAVCTESSKKILSGRIAMAEWAL